jgi:hypothetical protein
VDVWLCCDCSVTVRVAFGGEDLNPIFHLQYCMMNHVTCVSHVDAAGGSSWNAHGITLGNNSRASSMQGHQPTAILGIPPWPESSAPCWPAFSIASANEGALYHALHTLVQERL